MSCTRSITQNCDNYGSFHSVHKYAIIKIVASVSGANSVEGYGPIIPDCLADSTFVNNLPNRRGFRVDFQECISAENENVRLY